MLDYTKSKRRHAKRATIFYITPWLLEMQRLTLTVARAALLHCVTPSGKCWSEIASSGAVAAVAWIRYSHYDLFPSAHGRQYSTSAGHIAAANSLLEAAQAQQFHPRLAELRQQHSCLPYQELVEECKKSLGSSTREDAERVCQALHSAGVLLKHGELALLRPADIADVAQQLLPINEAGIKARLAAAQEALAPLEARRAALARRLALKSGLLQWSGLAVLGVHFAVFLRLTYWELSWDVMEPVGFLVSSFSTILMYAWFMRTQSDFTWSEAQQRMVSRWESRVYQKANFPWEQYCQLKREVQRYSDMLDASRRRRAGPGTAAAKQSEGKEDGAEMGREGGRPTPLG